MDKRLKEVLKKHLSPNGIHFILNNKTEAFEILNAQFGISKSDFKSLVKEIQNENLNKILRKENIWK